MKLGMLVGYSGSRMNLPMDAIKHAESCGYDSVWTAEAYGSDAVTPATWILANTTKIRRWHGHYADAGTLAGDGGHDGDEFSAAL